MKKIGVVGLGIIGGSLVKEKNKKGLADWIVAYNRNPEAAEMALQEGTVQQAAEEIDTSFAGCEIIFICVPVDKISEIVQKLSHVVDKNTILTDVGSTKSDVIRASAKFAGPVRLSADNPMPGREATGYRAARRTC